MEIENTQPSLHLLPVEIIEEILSRLTVKLLLRFRCVSKSWRSLIESKRFIKHHLRNSTKNTCLAHQRVLVQNNNKEAKLSQCSLLSDKSDMHDLELNFLTNDDDDPIYSIYIAGCCNGLVCVLLNLNTYVDDCNTQFILWNPSIKISKKLPDIHNKSYCIKRYGFGWDESSGDYKVIAIVRVEEQTLCKIYSSKTDSWKAIDDCALSLSLKSHEPRGMLASGKLHWESYSPKWEIVAFDLNREAFEIVEQPSTYSSDGFCWPSLGMLGECLLVHCIRERCNDIWVMKEYGVKESWEKVMVISKFPCPPRTSPFVDAFCIGTKAEILLIRGRTFLISEMKKNCFRGQFPSYDMDFLDNWHCRLYDSDIYIESLVSPLEGRSNPH